MPSGATHDRVTLWSLPVVTGITLAITRNSELTLIVAGGHLFSGLMFSPDLDLHSRPFLRWGWLRWIWIPYQKLLSHRSVLSHGLIIGTTLRVIYLTIWIALAGIVIIGVAQLFRDVVWSWELFWQAVGRSLFNYRWQWLALFVGLEIGAIAHILSDTLGSAYKRYKRYGWKGLQKRKPTKKRRTSSTRSRKKASK